MKPNYRPNGYEYLCLASNDCKYGQKKFSTHRMVMKAFNPVDNMDNLTVNHINGNKKENYVNIVSENGETISNLEWNTHKENVIHSRVTGLNKGGNILSKIDANIIRNLHSKGYSYEQIRNLGYDNVSSTTIQNICKNIIYVDTTYIPKTYLESYKYNPANIHKLTDYDANMIRNLHKNGISLKDIKNSYFPDFSISTLSDIIRNKTHNR